MTIIDKLYADSSFLPSLANVLVIRARRYIIALEKSFVHMVHQIYLMD